MNAEQFKIMRGRKGQGRSRKETLSWEEKEIKDVKICDYLGYVIQKQWK